MSVDMKKLLALAGAVKDRQKARPQASIRKPWRIVNATSDEATVYIYDDIGQDMWGDGISSADFAQELDGITAPRINVRLNSQGGHVFEGVAMYEAIKRHPANTVGWVDGLAASAASFIAMACDTLVMAKAGRMMIHDAGVGGIYISGNAREVREAVKEVEAFADLLDSLSDTIAQIYVDKAGGTVAEWRSEMSTDRWYTAEEAVAKGLADHIDKLPAPSPSARGEVQPVNKSPETDDVKGLYSTLKGVFA
jgi:ATP-dependent protease ClpP protease subunit